ncbi:hypothetical protein QIS99_18145 [Streptomyces sp. B-S-A8]|uniref:Uncharacterized protein n=1 Tax=Streptomyces solicavernae TaxID=3043614 RepID=A0ABT6RUI9_9ACTN|nr:hypothetical protein [Streptomyces sp. B-S-A8]MDI3388107.1 hypothetical protein [Streptomyces sp. B-S-A8]
MQPHHKLLLLAVAATPLALSAAPAQAGAEPVVAWRQVGDDAQTGISGLALTAGPADRIGALVVRDNKKPGESRIGQLAYERGESGAASVTPVVWQGPEPVDLEAVEAVPGTPGEYVALASRGLVYHLRATPGSVRVLDVSPLPGIEEGADFEGFALTSQPGGTVAVWADRGAGADRPATVFAAPFSFDAYGAASFGAVQRESFRATAPQGEVRHVSDIALTGTGRILVSSASDAGDDGPFASAVSEAGRVSVDAAGSPVRLRLSDSPTVLGTFEEHKIEALECLPDSPEAVLGTDDENLGGFVTSAPLCGS